MKGSSRKERSLPRKRVVAIGALILMIALIALVAVRVCIPMLKMAGNAEEFRAFMEEKGAWGIVLFVAVTAMQVVVAVIPAGPLEVVAGYCFGSFKGALIVDAGMTIGSMAVFLLVRRFGMEFTELFIAKEKLNSVKFLKTNGCSILTIFLLFLIPGVPKDVLAYGIGLTDLSPVLWVFITAVGRFPSILLSTMSGDALMGRRYDYLAAVVAVLAVLTVVGTVIYRRMEKEKVNGEEGA